MRSQTPSCCSACLHGLNLCEFHVLALTRRTPPCPPPHLHPVQRMQGLSLKGPYSVCAQAQSQQDLQALLQQAERVTGRYWPARHLEQGAGLLPPRGDAGLGGEPPPSAEGSGFQGVHSAPVLGAGAEAAGGPPDASLQRSYRSAPQPLQALLQQQQRERQHQQQQAPPSYLPTPGSFQALSRAASSGTAGLPEPQGGPGGSARAGSEAGGALQQLARSARSASAQSLSALMADGANVGGSGPLAAGVAPSALPAPNALSAAGSVPDALPDWTVEDLAARSVPGVSWPFAT